VADFKIDIREIRKERTQIGALREENGGTRTTLAAEMRKGFADLRQELAAQRTAMIRGDLMTRIWMLLMCAAMLGVIARGLHWL